MHSLKQRGADFVNVHNQLSRSAYFAIADETKKEGIPFAGHVPFVISQSEAADAGQKSIEHLTGLFMACSIREVELREAMLKEMESWDTRIGPVVLVYERAELDSLDTFGNAKAGALFKHFVKHKTWQVPTLTMLRANSFLNDNDFKNDSRLKYIPAPVRKFWDTQTQLRFKNRTSEDWAKRKTLFQRRLELVSDMHHAGIEFLTGSDAPLLYTFPGFSLHDELALLVKAGFKPMEALQTATIHPARFLGRQADLGTVEKGKLADMVLLDADPLEDIGNSQKIRAVILNGKYLDRTDLDRMLKNAEAAVAEIGFP